MKLLKKVRLFILIALFIVLIQTPPKSYSKYYSVVNGESGAAVASYVFLSSINLSEPISLDEKLYPGITYEYSFTIKNFDGNVKSNVDLLYSLSITKTNNLPIEMKLYKDDVLIENNEIENEPLKLGVDMVHNYKLVITWDDTINDYKYADLSDDINLTIDVNQVD